MVTNMRLYKSLKTNLQSARHALLSSPCHQSERGFSLLEIAVALVVVGLATAELIQLSQSAREQTKAEIVASRAHEVETAAKAYIRAHYPQLLSLADAGPPVVVPIGKDSASGSIPSGPGPLPSIQGDGLLSQSYIDRNAYNQQHALLVREIDPGYLSAVLTTWGGNPIPDAVLADVPQHLGAAGGRMLTNELPSETGKVMGNGGGWELVASDWAATWSGNDVTPSEGHVMLNMGFSEGTVLSDYLYRNDIGIPEANTMNTTLIMGDGTTNQDIQDAGDITSDTISTTDRIDACSDDAAGCGYGLSNAGQIIDLNDGWITMEGNGNGVHIANTAGTGALEVDGRIYADDGVHIRGDWLRVDGSAGVLWEDWNGGFYMSDADWIRAYNDKSITTGGRMYAGTHVETPVLYDADDNAFYLDPDSTSRLNDLSVARIDAISDNTVVDVGRAKEYRLADLLPTMVPQRTFQIQGNNGPTLDIAKPTCGTNPSNSGSPLILVNANIFGTYQELVVTAMTGGPHTHEVNSMSAYTAADMGSFWRVVLANYPEQADGGAGSGYQPSDPYMGAVATTYCYYP